jgi:hypothetical protein
MSADPNEPVDQDPGIPGVDTISEPPRSPPHEEKDPEAEARERIDDADDEGHQAIGDAP